LGDLHGQVRQALGVVAHLGQQRHGLGRQVGGLDDDLRHRLHLRLEGLDLEQADHLGGLAHLVDGVVQRRRQVLDVATIERRDEAAADGLHHLAGDLVGLFLVQVHPGGGRLDAVGAAHQVAQRL
jgi:hypothetical protein